MRDDWGRVSEGEAMFSLWSICCSLLHSRFQYRHATLLPVGVVPKSYLPKGQPRSTRNEFPIRADFGNSRKHPIWRLKRGGKLTAKGAVLSPEKRDFTVLLTKFAFIVTFEEFLVLHSEQSFYKCLINLSCPSGRHYRRK